MKHSQYLEIDQQIDDLLNKLPIIINRIYANVEQIKKQQNDCASAMMKTTLENNFQLGATLLINYTAMLNNAITYSQTTDQINDIRYRSLVDFGYSIKDSINAYVSVEGIPSDAVAKHAKAQQEYFSTFTALYERQRRSALYKFLSMVSFIYASAVVTDLILTEGKQNELADKVQSVSELVKSIISFIPNIGTLLGVSDFVSAIRKIIKTCQAGDSSCENIQAADMQFVHLEQQNKCLTESLKLQKEISSYIDDCLAYALAQKDAIEAASG